MLRLITVSFICLIFTSCKAQKMVSKKYYKDFHPINIEGINEIDKNGIGFPYVEIVLYDDSTKEVSFCESRNRKSTKIYRYQNGVYVNKNKIIVNDAGCSYFTELKYFFTKGKTVTYVYCEDADSLKSGNLYKIYIESLSDIDEPYNYYFKSTVPSSLLKPLIAFNPELDFDGRFFSEIGAFVDETKLYIKNDSLVEESKSYYVESGGELKYISNINHTSAVSKPLITIWKSRGLDK